MLHAHDLNPLYRVFHDEEQIALVEALAINIQDRAWLVYCTLSDQPHPYLPEADPRTGRSLLPFAPDAG
ncbi:hypothetical protein [Zestomonas thermotolerans]|jgi:hypothetical protein|uniref:hypothetical protein n=1 Tax=Zestomonas thermotolerans TaxID=157784 RepID=UPI000380B4AF|nr:hypothetical protein [Pseudomonas thermotolerans]MBO2511868.1 hypothetical protein [Gammaproteobacteria bacterium]